MKRKFFYFLALIALLLGGLIVFRHSVMVIGTKSFFQKTFPKNYSFQEISAKNDHVYIYGLQAKKNQMELTLDGLEVSFEWKEIFKSPKVLWNLYRNGFSDWTDVIWAMRQYGMNLSVQTGILQLEDQRYYFQLKAGEKKHEVGTLFVSHDPGLFEHPFLVLQLHMRGDQLISQVLVEEVPSQRLFQLASFAFPDSMSGFNGLQGDVQLRASVILEKDGSIDEVSTRFTCSNFEIHHPKNQLAVRMDKLSGDLNYPEGIEDTLLPVWKRMQCGLSLENGTLIFGDQLAIAGLEGNLSLDPRIDPALTLHGEVVGQEKPLALKLVGKGAVHEDHAYWLEFGLNLDDRSGTGCDAFLSICSPEKESLVFQVEASHLLPQQVEMLKGYFAKSLPRLRDWEVKQGSFGGKLVALFEKGELAHFEIQGLEGTNVTLSDGDQLFYFSNLRGEGRLFEELNFEIDLPVAHFLALFSSDLSEIFSSYRPDDFAHIATTINFDKNKVVTAASIDFLGLEESIQFGFESGRAFPSSWEEIRGGWARSQKLSHLLYGPFVCLAHENLKIYGNVDLLASYEGGKIELSLQIDDFLSKHPFLDLKAATIGSKETTEGRAKITFDPVTKAFSGLLPLRDAKAYDRQYGLVFEKLNADINLGPDEIRGHLARADISFEGKTFLKKTELDFAQKEEMKLTNIKAQLALDTDKEFWIEAKYFDQAKCDFLLLDGKKQLASFKGTREEDWKGALTLHSLKDPLTVQLHWDPIANTTLLHAVGKDLSLLCKKEAEKFTFQEFTKGGWSCQASFALNSEGVNISQLGLRNNGTSAFKAAGDLFIDLPTQNSPLTIRSDLDVTTEFFKPVAIQLTSSERIKATYTLETGVVFSDLKLSGGDSTFFTSLFEYFPNEGSFRTKQAIFNVSQPLLDQFFASGALPEFLSNLQICRGLNGQAALALEEGALSIDGFLNADEESIPIHLDWKEKNGSLAIGDKTPLTFKGGYGEEGFTLESIRGSFNAITADLKRLGKKQLKGSVKLDFASLKKLADTPLNEYITKWKTGSGYQFEGIITPRGNLKNWGFKGNLKGDRFECAGYKLRSIETKLEIEPGQITLENLDLTDDAGKMWIGEGALMRSGDEWVFSFPAIEIRGFQPSFLCNIAGPEKEITPLVIKSATISNLRGSLTNPMSVTGSGNLRFSNLSKSSEHRLVKHLPVEVLQELGIEAGFFIPTSGEMDYSIQNGRCYLREVRNMISGKGISEFIPPRSGVLGYLDFEGNFFVDMQVRQRGNRVASPPHSYKVRGKWEEPKIIIK